jgi:hypothetical protein
MADLPVDGELAKVSGPFRALAERLVAAPPEDRTLLLEGYSLGDPDPAALLEAIGDARPDGPAPPVEPPRRFATCADIDRVQSATDWVWKGWLPSASVAGVAAGEGVGKTVFVMDLCRRVWHGEPWPDGEPMTLAARTPSVWVAADGQHRELARALKDRNMPPGAILFPTGPEEPFGGTSLDDPETLRALDEACRIYRPPFVVVDSFTYATRWDICEQQAISRLKDPLVDLAQAHQVVVLLLLHVSREGQALGRRIRGVTRSLLHLEAPDPGSPRLRLWVEKSFSVKPPALEVTIGAGGNTYDPDPSPAPEPRRPGRSPVKSESCKRWLADRVGPSGAPVAEVRRDAEKAGYSAGVLYDARDALRFEELTIEGRKWWRPDPDSDKGGDTGRDTLGDAARR